MEPSKGNHFGFYEGSLLQAFDARNDSYTYPAKVSTVFFRTVESHLEAGKRWERLQCCSWIISLMKDVDFVCYS